MYLFVASKYYFVTSRLELVQFLTITLDVNYVQLASTVLTVVTSMVPLIKA
jgi:hypothetical protein